MQPLTIGGPQSEIACLENAIGKSFANLNAAKKRAVDFREMFEASVQSLNSDDSIVVVFGSLARNEFTEGSAVDWTLLIDGIANPKHLRNMSHRFRDALLALFFDERSGLLNLTKTYGVF